MGQNVTLGGERVGSGKKMQVETPSYNRSTHDLSSIWKSTISAGTIVPFLTKVALPGDTFDINLAAKIVTLPTIGPLYGSYKLQMDLYLGPIRLYNGKLHMNLINIGLDMSSIYLPMISMQAHGKVDFTRPIDNQQINASCIFKYLGMTGLGTTEGNADATITRRFNATTWLLYWDIVKQYYANKQEENGAVIHKNLSLAAPTITNATIANADDSQEISIYPVTTPIDHQFTPDTTLTIIFSPGALTSATTASQIQLQVSDTLPGPTYIYTLDQLFTNIIINPDTDTIYASGVYDGYLPPYYTWVNAPARVYYIRSLPGNINQYDVEPTITLFPLENIDQMRKNILAYVNTDAPYELSSLSIAPYGLALQANGTPPPISNIRYAKQYSQEGLALKTYQSDLLNNWIQTEFIEGENGINELTKITVGIDDSFTINEFILNKKIFDMLNHIAASGGTYDDWLTVNWDHDRPRGIESPMYVGGMSQELVFEEVVSNAASADQPLGTLAGRGRLMGQPKGGKTIIKVNEPSYIMGLVSLTPRLDYSQGNDWDVNLKTLNDLHKPALDQIGFQDLITDQMAWWDTKIDGAAEPVFKSAGKQPAWVNYMTDINRVRGAFAEQNNMMFMVLNRKYGLGFDGEGSAQISDVTTYVDPTKFNNIFADTTITAQNFQIQIAIDIEARRKMSAKIMPNL